MRLREETEARLAARLVEIEQAAEQERQQADARAAELELAAVEAREEAGREVAEALEQARLDVAATREELESHRADRLVARARPRRRSQR